MLDNKAKGGISFLTAVAIVFAILKLTNVVTWSWWVVVAPVLIGPILWSILLVFGVKLFTGNK